MMESQERIYKEVKIVKLLKLKSYSDRKSYSVEIDFVNNYGNNRRIEIGMRTLKVLKLKEGSKIIIYHNKNAKWIDYRIDYDKTYELYGQKCIPYYKNKFQSEQKK